MKIRKIFYGNIASGKSVLAKQLEDVFLGYTYHLFGDFGLEDLLLQIRNNNYLEKLSNEAMVMFIIEDCIGTHTQEILEYFRDRNFPIIIITEKEPNLPKELLKTVDVVKCSYSMD